MNCLSMLLSEEHLGNDESWKKILLCCLGEFIGNFFLNFFGCLSVLGGSSPPMVFGLVIAVLVQVIGPLSGAHLNPAVSIAAVIGGKTPIIRASCYLLFQIMGSLVGTILLMILPKQNRGLYALNVLEVDIFPGLIIELFLGFILVLVVFGVTDENNPNARVPAPYAIGLTVTLCVYVAIAAIALESGNRHRGSTFDEISTVKNRRFIAGPYTSASMNPARSLGSAIVSGEFKDIWVFIAGPIIGAILAAVLYKFVLGPGLQETKGEEG